MTDIEEAPGPEGAAPQQGDELIVRLRTERDAWRGDVPRFVAALTGGEADAEPGADVTVVGAAFGLDLPVSRADVVAEALAALDRRWQLVLALLEEDGETTPDAPIQFDVGTGLQIVDARMAPLQLRLRPTRRGMAKLAALGGGGVAAAAGVAQLIGYDVRDVGRGFTAQGDRSEPISRDPLELAEQQQLAQRLGRLPTGASVRIDLELDTGAHYVVVMPPFPPGDLPSVGRDMV